MGLQENCCAHIFRRDQETWIEQAKLPASSVCQGTQFGFSAAINGSYAVAGAWRDNDNGFRSGAAYIFKREQENWIEYAKLTASDGTSDDRFGWSMAMDDKYIIVGARGENFSRGVAYIYEGDFAVSVSSSIPITPKNFTLEQNYPNPFNPYTTITYRLATAADVELTIYNHLSQKIRVLVHERHQAGTYTISWDGRNTEGQQVASSLYLYPLKANSFIRTRKMVLLR